MEDIEKFWNAVRVHRVEVTPQTEGPESVLDRAFARMETELDKVISERVKGGTYDHIRNAIVVAARTLVTALYEEQQNQDISLVIQLFLEAPNKPPDEIKSFLRALPRTLLNKILVRMKKGNKHETGFQMMLSLEALYRDGMLHQDYEVTKDGDNKLQIIFYPKEVNGPLSFRLRDMFIGG